MPQDDLQIVMKAKDILKKEDFESALNRVLTFVLKIQEDQQHAIQSLQKTYEAVITKLQNDHSTNYNDLKKQVNGLFVDEKVNKMSTEQKQLFVSLKQEMSRMIDQKLKEVDVKVEQRAKAGPAGPKGEPGRPPTAKEIEMALQPNVEAFRTSWEEKVQQTLARRGLGVGGGRQPQMRTITITGTVDGSNKTFTLDSDYSFIMIYWNGQLQQPTTHYTQTGRTINFVDGSIPSSGVVHGIGYF